MRCLDDGWIAGGRRVIEFEEAWAAYCGRSYGVAVSNGTVALQLAVASLNLPHGSKIAMPAFTIMSCPLAAIHNGLIPKLVDVDPDTWCIDVDKAIEAMQEPTVRAVMPVHMYGHPANMSSLVDHAKRRFGITVIEDAAQAHGAEYEFNGVKKAGFAGQLSCFSFYSNKLVTTGEGGMVLTDDQKSANHMRSLRNLCFGHGDDRFKHVGLGHNFRMTDLQAAVGVAQIKSLEARVKAKRRLAGRYREILQHSSIQHPVELPGYKNVYWMYGIVLDRPARPIMKKLQEAGVETRPFFHGLHRQPPLRQSSLDATGQFPVTDRLSTNGLYLPSGTKLSDDQIEFAATKLLEAL